MCVAGYVPSGVATCSSGQWDSPTCVLDPLSFIYSLPLSTSDSIEAPQALETTSYEDTSSVATGSNKWYGGVLGPNGKIYGIPGSAEVALIIDTTNNDAVSSLDITGVATGSNKWFGGVLGPNGKIYGMPDSAEAVLVIDIATDFSNITANYISAYRNKF